MGYSWKSHDFCEVLIIVENLLHLAQVSIDVIV